MAAELGVKSFALEIKVATVGPVPNPAPVAKRPGILRKRYDLITQTHTMDPGAPSGRPRQVEGREKINSSVILNLIQDPVAPTIPLGPKSSLG